MKILRLQSSNIMRLLVVDITPEGHLITVGGKNGAGKSSVLNSIAMALGGKAMVPMEPIRVGESEGKITVDLGDIIVTRKFTRAKQKCDCDHSSHTTDCASHDWDETKSTLIVANKDGATYPSPQAMLDKLLGKLTFDPLAFSREESKKQDEILRKLIGVDTTILEGQRKTAYTNRAMAKKSHEIKAAQLLALPMFPDAPKEEIPLSAVSEEMLKAEQCRTLATNAARVLDSKTEKLSNVETSVATQHTLIKELEQKLLEENKKLEIWNNRLQVAQEELRLATEDHLQATSIIPDTEAIQKKLADIEATNVKVRANQKHEAMSLEVLRLDAEVQEHDLAVKTAEEQKRKILESAQFPVPGLGLNDEGVTFGGLPFAQASSSEQLRVSVAIGLSLNPTLKVLLIRSGNLLDDDSLQTVAKQAEEADAQLWCEYVTGKSEGVSVFIEEGLVAQSQEAYNGI